MRGLMQRKKVGGSARVSHPPTETSGASNNNPAATTRATMGAIITRRPQTRRAKTATDLAGAVEALDDPERHVGFTDGAGGTGFFGATVGQIGFIPSASTTLRAAAAENGKGVSRVGSGNPRSEIGIGVEALDVDGITAAPG